MARAPSTPDAWLRDPETAPILRLFLSSPGDLAEEQALVKAVVARLALELRGRLRLDLFWWREEPLSAGAAFQAQIDARRQPSECDAAIFLLWTRMGTPIAPDLRLADGRPATGTEWEFEDALRGEAGARATRLLVYRKTAPVPVPVDETPDAHHRRRSDLDAVESFVAHRLQRPAAQGGGARASFRFGDAAQLRALLEPHLRRLATERLSATTRDARELEWVAAPYRGLEPYGVEHARIFFGRTEARHRVLAALQQQVARGTAFVAVVGPSGSGKSSLVQAGVLPLLRPDLVEPRLDAGRCLTAVVRPGAGASPLAALGRGLDGCAGLPRAPASVGWGSWEAGLLADPRGAAAALSAALAAADGGPARLALAVDQLEEAFTRPGASGGDLDPFLAALDALARGGTTYVLATLRGDFQGGLRAQSLLRELVQGAGVVELDPPDPAELREMICEPAAHAGLAFEVQAGTLRRLDEVLLAEAAGDDHALPVLSFTLAALVERCLPDGPVLTFAAYEALGGLSGVVGRRAAEAFGGAALDPAEHAALLRQLAALLVDVEEGEGRRTTRRWATVAEAEAVPTLGALVERLARARLLVMEAGDGAGPRFGLAHESLVRRWTALAEAVEEQRSQLTRRTALRDATRRWVAGGRRREDLLVGRRLTDALEILGGEAARSAQDPATRELVAASQARALRGRRVARTVTAAIAGLAVSVSLLWWRAAAHARAAADERDAKAVALEEVLRLADSKRVRDLRLEAEALFPRDAASAERAQALLRGAEEATRGRALHERTLERLRSRRTAAGVGRASDADAWAEQVLTQLLADTEAILAPGRGALDVLRRRFRQPEGLERLPAWDVVVRRIADRAENPVYGGLRLAPQWGLAPLGRNEATGLFEFAHLYSGSLPSPGASPPAADEGVVFVLLPGGTYWRGAAASGEHNVDAEVGTDEGPVHEVTVSPFFLAKTECTQAQWGRLTDGSSPSIWPEEAPGTEPRYPVDSVTWEECQGRPGWLVRYGLTLPTEAQWEYAARARPRRPGEGAPDGAPRWTGTEVAALLAAEVLRDSSAGRPEAVGSRRPNPFGLFDMLGNLSEWCLDPWDTGCYDRLLGRGAAERTDPVAACDPEKGRIVRGGHWFSEAREARSAARDGQGAGRKAGTLGVRPARALEVR